MFYFSPWGVNILDEELEVVYTELLQRGVAVKVENKLLLGIGDDHKKEKESA
jgi:hypothetical protein